MPYPASALPTAPPPPSGATLAKLPVNLFGAVMGLSGTALAWRLAHRSLGASAWIGEAFGAAALAAFALIGLAYLVKLAKHPGAVRAEFRHPVAGNFFGTIAISVLLLAAVVAPYDAAASQAIWTVGVAATFALGFVVVSRLLGGRLDASLAVPAWIVPCVATLDIPVTGAHMPMAWAPEINLLACAIGSVMALVLFTMIVNRLMQHDPLAPAMTPSLMILLAPFAVGFLAYTDMVGGIDRFAALLFYFGLFVFAVVAPKVFRPGIGFSASWWAIGFPLAALANAAWRYAEFRGGAPLWFVAIALLALLSGAMVLLAVRTVHGVLTGKLFA